MKKIENFEEIKASGEFDSLKPGGYIGVLYKAEDESEKEYLKVSFDIAEGEFAEYRKGLFRNFDWDASDSLQGCQVQEFGADYRG